MRGCVELTKAQARKLARVTTSSDAGLTELIQYTMSGRCVNEDQAQEAIDELRSKISGAPSLHKGKQIIARLLDVQRAVSQYRRNHPEEEL